MITATFSDGVTLKMFVQLKLFLLVKELEFAKESLCLNRDQNWAMTSIETLAKKFQSLDPAVRSMFDQIEQLLKLLLTIPASNAEEERSFCLRYQQVMLRRKEASAYDTSK